jgi:hypothetical protein
VATSLTPPSASTSLLNRLCRDKVTTRARMTIYARPVQMIASFNDNDCVTASNVPTR